MTAYLLAWGDLLAAHRVTHIALKNRDVYWKSVYYVFVTA